MFRALWVLRFDNHQPPSRPHRHSSQANAPPYLSALSSSQKKLIKRRQVVTKYKTAEKRPTKNRRSHSLEHTPNPAHRLSGSTFSSHRSPGLLYGCAWRTTPTPLGVLAKAYAQPAKLHSLRPKSPRKLSTLLTSGNRIVFARVEGSEYCLSPSSQRQH